MSNIQLSILDQSQIRTGSTAREALQETTRLAILADQLGYNKFWLSEHHNIPEIASPAPELLIAYLAGQTKRIHFGAAGIMLPNHSALKVAENFRLLENLFPGRISLGMGGASGGDLLAARQLNPSNPFTQDNFVNQIREVMNFISDHTPKYLSQEHTKAFPYSPSTPPLWILTSSGGNARTAGQLGLGLSLAHFINPNGGPEIVADYKKHFISNSGMKGPCANLGIFAFCSEDEELLDQWQTVFAYRLLHIDSGNRSPLLPYDEIKKIQFTDDQKKRLRYNSRRMISGNPNDLKKYMEALANYYDVNEIMICTVTEKEEDKLNSFRLLAEVFGLKA